TAIIARRETAYATRPTSTSACSRMPWAGPSVASACSRSGGLSSSEDCADGSRFRVVASALLPAWLHSAHADWGPLSVRASARTAQCRCIRARSPRTSTLAENPLARRCRTGRHAVTIDVFTHGSAVPIDEAVFRILLDNSVAGTYVEYAKTLKSK